MIFKDKYKAINSFIDSEGKIIQWPSKKKKKQQRLILEYLLEKVDSNVKYSEIELSNLLNEYHHFKDAALLRREMVEKSYLKRTRDCKAYWVNPVFIDEG